MTTNRIINIEGVERGQIEGIHIAIQTLTGVLQRFLGNYATKHNIKGDFEYDPEKMQIREKNIIISGGGK